MDRNICPTRLRPTVATSLSARRAWIEILLMWYQCNTVVVALRKESVDRNNAVVRKLGGIGVALRKESVDRNYVSREWRTIRPGRSPQGERG